MTTATATDPAVRIDPSALATEFGRHPALTLKVTLSGLGDVVALQRDQVHAALIAAVRPSVEDLPAVATAQRLARTREGIQQALATARERIPLAEEARRQALLAGDDVAASETELAALANHVQQLQQRLDHVAALLRDQATAALRAITPLFSSAALELQSERAHQRAALIAALEAAVAEGAAALLAVEAADSMGRLAYQLVTGPALEGIGQAGVDHASRLAGLLGRLGVA